MSRRQAELRSSCAAPIKAFLEFKRAIGRKYRTEAAALRLLDAYLAAVLQDFVPGNKIQILWRSPLRALSAWKPRRRWRVTG